MILIDIDGKSPKRGDIMQSNLGSRRERTWLIIRVRSIRRRVAMGTPRYQVFAVRWWEIEPDVRMRLYLSAVRNGGQGVLAVKRYPRKKRMTFEGLMARKVIQE